MHINTSNKNYANTEYIDNHIFNFFRKKQVLGQIWILFNS
jgi:hypothetical protein